MITEICKKAKAASVEMAKLSAEAKNTALCRMANALEANAEKILAANKADVEAAKAKGLKAALLDRLALDQKKIQTMAKDMREVSALADPIGTIISTWTRPNGLIISQVRVPLGVVGVIYESRPNVTSDSAGNLHQIRKRSYPKRRLRRFKIKRSHRRSAAGCFGGNSCAC